jgi:hypothetical protein
MGYTFDGEDKIISLTAGTTDFEVKDLYSRWKDWVATSDNAKYEQAFSVVGGDPTSGANFIYPYFFLENGWRVRPDEANHQLIVDGALLVNGGGNPYLPTLGSYNVQIIADVPVRAEGVDTGGGGGPSASQIADAVWDEAMSGHTTSGTFGERMRKLLTFSRFMGAPK